MPLWVVVLAHVFKFYLYLFIYVLPFFLSFSTPITSSIWNRSISLVGLFFFVLKADKISGMLNSCLFVIPTVKPSQNGNRCQMTHVVVQHITLKKKDCLMNQN